MRSNWSPHWTTRPKAKRNTFLRVWLDMKGCDNSNRWWISAIFGPTVKIKERTLRKVTVELSFHSLETSKLFYGSKFSYTQVQRNPNIHLPSFYRRMSCSETRYFSSESHLGRQCRILPPRAEKQDIQIRDFQQSRIKNDCRSMTIRTNG